MILERGELARVTAAALETLHQQMDCESTSIVWFDGASSWTIAQQYFSSSNDAKKHVLLSQENLSLLPPPEELPFQDSNHSPLIINLDGPQWRRMGIEEVLAAAIMHRSECCGLLIALRQRPRRDGWTVLQRSILRDRANWVSLAIRHHVLEQHAEDLSLALQQRSEELKQVQQEAEGAGRAKDAFLAAMSHEIRTPMNGILGMADLLLDSGLNDYQLDCTRTIRSSCESLMLIISDILCFSKIESGSFELEQRSFDLRSCIEEVVELLYEQATEKGNTITYRCDPSVPSHIIGDRNRLRQILLNLAGNSIKFTTQGSITIRVTLDQAALESVPVSRTISGEQCRLRFQVKDTGIGISSEHLARLFHPFQQGEARRILQHGGTGLGLVISRRLCRLMNGDIRAESEVNKGSCFTFTIETTLSQTLSKVTALQMQASRQTNCLLVSTDADQRLAIEDQLRFLGVTFVSTMTLTDAEAQLMKNVTPDVIIIDDSTEPEYTSGHWEKHLQPFLAGNYSRRHSLPRLILLTGNDRRTENTEETSTSQIYVLLKPTRLTQLANALEQLTKPSNSSAESTLSTLSKAQDNSCKDAEATQQALKILVVDDVKINQKLASRILERLGFSCTIVNNGLEAVDELRDRDFDVVLMDIEMPVMNGLEATTLIRKLKPARPQPWIIAMSAHARDEDRDICLRAGMDDYLSKPITIENLRDKLDLIQPVTSSNINAIDLSSWRQLCETTGDDPVELLDLYLEHSLCILERILSAYNLRHGEQLSNACHALFSPSATIGAKGLASYCQRVIIQIKDGQLNEALASTNALLEESARVTKRVEDLRIEYLSTNRLPA